MTLRTLPQTYLVPATSTALHKALTTLDALGLTYDSPTAGPPPGATLLPLTVHMPVIPVVHHLDLTSLRSELLDELHKRAERPSHVYAQGWDIGEPPIYDAAFFSHPMQIALTLSLADLVTREKILRHFTEQGIAVQKITLSRPAPEILAARRFGDWYAFAEEARPVVPELGVMLGAV